MGGGSFTPQQGIESAYFKPCKQGYSRSRDCSPTPSQEMSVNKVNSNCIYFWVSEVFLEFDFFVLWHINICGLFNTKAILVEEQQKYYLTHRRVGYKRVLMFRVTGVGTEYNFAIWHISDDPMGTLSFP